jgi:histidyl-tRNA synthetase
VERLLRKFRGTDDPAKLEEGLNLVQQLAVVRGDPESSIAKAEGLIRSTGLSLSGLDRLKEVVDLLRACYQDSPGVVLDFGLARGLAYYTGIVFEIRHPSVEASLGGGGRYDGLAKALGSTSSIPALGFAFTLQHLLSALGPAETQETPSIGQDRKLVITAGNGGAYRQALSLARELRDGGKLVEMEVCSRSVEESMEYARARGIGEIIEVGVSGQTTSHPVVSPADTSRARDGGNVR